MSHTSEDGDGLVAGINVTPLVDITLVLLVVMMVAAPIMAEARLTMQLPRATPDARAVESPRFVVELFADGRTVVDGRVVSRDDVKALARSPQRGATIRAEGEVRHARVIAMLDLLRSAGVDRVAFAVVPVSPSR